MLVVVTLSGGGKRASAMAYGLLEQLAADRLRHDGLERRLLDEVDVISAVSGGWLLYTSDAAHETRGVGLGGPRIISQQYYPFYSRPSRYS